MASIEQRLATIETYLFGFINSENRKDTYNEYDKQAIREGATANTEDITDNRKGIEESYELGLNNSDDLADLRTALEEVYELIEGGN